MKSLGYLIKEGFKSLWKNRTMTIASIGVLLSCLLITGVAGLLSMNLSVMMKSVEGNNSITVFLNDNLPRLTSIKIGEELRTIPNVSDYTFQSKEEGMESVIGQLGEHGGLLSGLIYDGNFLPDAYVVTMKDLSQYDETIEQITSIEGVDYTTDYREIANKLSNLDRMVRYASIIIVVVLGLVSLFIISNTIRVTMYSRRMEISIMKSVGATNGFVRIPFVVEGMIIGIISAVISVIVLFFAYGKLIETMSSFVPFLATVDINPLMWLIVLIYLAVGMLFGILGSTITMGKFLRNEGENAVV